MLTWQQPGWLWALLGLAVPLLIHLLNAASGRTVRFPAVQFVVADKARRVRSIALQQPLLLALRLTLLALLACWLAGPTWTSATAAPDQGQVLVSPLALQLHPELAAEQAGSLAAQRGVEARLLAPGFPDLSQPAHYNGPAPLVLQGLADGLADGLANGLANGLTDTWPAGTEVLVADHPLDRTWQYQPVPDGIVMTPVAADAAQPLKVALAVTDRRDTDARYVRAALAALASRGDLVWQELTPEDPELTSAVDVVITLGAVPQGTLPEHRLRLTDGEVGEADWAGVPVEGPGALFSAGYPADTGVLLADQAGQALVTLGQADQQPVITINGRFHPRYNPLVSSGTFPDWLAQWLGLATVVPQTIQVAGAKPAPVWLGLLLLAVWLGERWLARR